MFAAGGAPDRADGQVHKTRGGGEGKRDQGISRRGAFALHTDQLRQKVSSSPFSSYRLCDGVQEFNLEKLQLLEQEKAKIRKEYERREGQVDVKKKM